MADDGSAMADDGSAMGSALPVASVTRWWYTWRGAVGGRGREPADGGGGTWLASGGPGELHGERGLTMGLTKIITDHDRHGFRRLGPLPASLQKRAPTKARSSK